MNALKEAMFRMSMKITVTYFETEQEQAENDDDYEAYTFMNAYGDEPIADEEWLRQYNQQQEEQENQEEEFKRRLDGTTPLHLW